MSIEQEIKELRTKLDELEKHVNAKNKIERYIPKYLQKYFYVLSEGTILEETCTSTSIDEHRIAFGNCFRTEEEAEKHKRILINTQKLKDLAERLNNGCKVDFSCEEQHKYYIIYDCNCVEGFFQEYNATNQVQGVVYCLDKNFLAKAVEEIGEEELIELIKGEIND